MSHRSFFRFTLPRGVTTNGAFNTDTNAVLTRLFFCSQKEQEKQGRRYQVQFRNKIISYNINLKTLNISRLASFLFKIFSKIHRAHSLHRYPERARTCAQDLHTLSRGVTPLLLLYILGRKPRTCIGSSLLYGDRHMSLRIRFCYFISYME